MHPSVRSRATSPREDAINRLRERAATNADSPRLLWLHGDPGAGKTRTIAEALDTPELRDGVLYVEGGEELQRITTTLIRIPDSTGILFADEVDGSEAESAFKKLGATRGRWRMVAVTSRDRRVITEGPGNLVLPPLDAPATKRLVEEHAGLPADAARMVAEVAAGFPELALRLADELRADPSLDLVQLANLPGSTALLARALGDEDVRRHLAPIALFAAVGFDEELRYELEAVAAAFDLDADEIEKHCEIELRRRRFVSSAGRYRLVSPLLVAVWLVTELVDQTPRFEEKVFALPGPLLEAFMRQLDFFGREAPHLPEALVRVLAADRFRRPEAFDEAAGRFLRASAAIVPTQVAQSISQLLGASSKDQLGQLPRRELVWALQVLLWWPETWDAAANGLYLLAQEENETVANNATGVFSGAFTVFLSGSEVPYEHRALWLKRRVPGASSNQLELLARAATAGLASHHSRVRVGFRGGGEPADWQPLTIEELVANRHTAWSVLLAIRDESDQRDHLGVTKKLESALRVVYSADLGADVDGDLRAREWSIPERASLGAGLRDVLMYETVDEATKQAVLALHDWLLGDDLAERLAIVLSTTLWDLHADQATIHGTPPLLEEVARRLAELGADGVDLALSRPLEASEGETRFSLLRLLSERLGAERVGTAAVDRKDWHGLAGALSIADELGEGAWADHLLATIGASEPSRVPELLTFVDLTNERIDRVLSLIEAGGASADALARLIYGARIGGLDESHAVRVLEAVVAAGGVEAGLGMLDQWLDQHDGSSEALVRVAGELAYLAATGPLTTMGDYYFQRLVDRDMLDSEAVGRVWEIHMAHRQGLVGGVDRALTSLLLRHPASASPRIMGAVRESRTASLGYFASRSDLALLSQLAAVTSASEVWEQIANWPEIELRWALHHMDWRGDAPEPLVREFLCSKRLEEVANEASVCFFNTLGVVSGPFHRGLEKELERAKQWRLALEGTSAAHWADELVEGYEQQIEWHRRRDAEDDLRLG